jgi:hypothetical protein
MIKPFTMHDLITQPVDYKVGKSKPPSPKKGKPQMSPQTITRERMNMMRDMMFKQGMTMHKVRMMTGHGSRMIKKIHDGEYMCVEDYLEQ